MDFEEARLRSIELNEINSGHSKILNELEVGKMGLTPEHVRLSPEYRKALSDFDKSFAELRRFNGWFMKTFKKEYLSYRSKNRFKKC